jgi:hypothetical protein
MRKCVNYATGMERRHSSHDLGTGVNVVSRQDSERIQRISDTGEDSNTNHSVNMKGTKLLGEYFSCSLFVCTLCEFHCQFSVFKQRVQSPHHGPQEKGESRLPHLSSIMKSGIMHLCIINIFSLQEEMIKTLMWIHNM